MKPNHENFQAVKDEWLKDCLQQLAITEETRASLKGFLSEFANGLEISLAGGDPGVLKPLLERWSGARTLSDLESSAGSLVQVLQQAHGVLLQTARRCLAADEALALMSRLQPSLLSANEYAIKLEIEAVTSHLTRELELSNQTLERLDRSKSDFIAIAAHELKTPLTLIEGYLSMLKERIEYTGMLDEFAILFDGMDHGSRRLKQIIEDMVDVSLIDNQLLSLNFQPMWLDRIFEGLKHEFEPALMERKQEFTIHPFPGSDELIYGDEERLYQAFRNLVTNAIKYTPDGGTISISGRSLPGFVDVLVQDTGIGILPENQVMIFEKFGRLGNTLLHTSSKTSFKGGGPGLGLPITKGIISAHGGAIWVESETCDEIRCPGTTFHVVLPVRKTPPDHLSAKLFEPLSGFERNRDNDTGF